MMTIAELKALPQWVGYNTQKIPLDAHTGTAAASNNPLTWSTASEAWAAKRRYGWAGIGYVFTIAAGVVGIDLDDCFNDAGELSDMALQVMQITNSYTERSPSGKGLHILACGEIPHSVKPPGGGFEMYNELRYFTVTGHRYGARPPDIEDRQKELLALFVTFGGDMEPHPPARRPAIERGNLTADEAEVARALACLPAQGDYNTDWLPALMAVHDAFPDDRGIALIEAWSPGKQGEVARKWRSFESIPGGNRITIATLFHKAKQYGYEAIRRQSTRATQRGSDITDALARRRNGNSL